MAKFCTPLLLLITVLTTWAAAENPNGGGLLSCLQASGIKNVTAVSSANFDSLLDFSAQNLRFTEPQVSKPYVIIIPASKSQLQQSVVCTIENGWEVRVRSGGHSYEGLSYTSEVPFVLIDLAMLNKITIDTTSKTAWVEAGATLGEIYSAVASSSPNLAFSAGICATIGSGGHISGGGQSYMFRKYGLAADNTLDALLINASGKIMDKNTMGEDVFWAVRGGGGGSWGVVFAWKIGLVSVPSIVTTFNVQRYGRDNVTDLVHRWQYLAPQMDEDITMRIMLAGINVNDTKVSRASFNGLYLGQKDELVAEVGKVFPELGMAANETHEMSWVESIAYFNPDLQNISDQYYPTKSFFKIKSDFAKSPISKSGISGLLDILDEEVNSFANLNPHGGRMDEIPSSAIPFPHRAGTLFGLQYLVIWANKSQDDYYLEWMRKLYKYMEPHVSHSPRSAYVNYLDLDLGSAFNGSASVEEARGWGERYFHGNFDRLVKAKTQVDPLNFFRNSQSIPPIWN